MKLTAELIEVGLDLPPGVQEDAALLRAHRDHTVLVNGDARHLGVELGHGHALQSESHRLLVRRTRPQSAPSPRQCPGRGADVPLSPGPTPGW